MCHRSWVRAQTCSVVNKIIFISVITDTKVNGIYDNTTMPSCQQIQKEDNF